MKKLLWFGLAVSLTASVIVIGTFLHPPYEERSVGWRE